MSYCFFKDFDFDEDDEVDFDFDDFDEVGFFL
jgi:hypothetical protein